MSKQPRQWFNVVNEGGKSTGTILVYGFIGKLWWEDDSVGASDFVQALQALEADHDVINIRINSYGGLVADGLAMINAIKRSKAEVHTFNDGVAFSMGGQILMAGHKVHAAKNSLTMLHAVLSWAYGNAEDFRRMAADLDKWTAAMSNDTADRTGQTVEEVIAKYYDGDDHLFTAQEALDEGLVDDILDVDADRPEGVEKMNYKEAFAFFIKDMVPQPAEGQHKQTAGPVARFFKNALDITGIRAAKENKFPALQAILNALNKSADISADMVAAVQQEVTADTHGIVVMAAADPQMALTDRNEEIAALQQQLADIRAAAGIAEDADDTVDVVATVATLKSNSDVHNASAAEPPKPAAKQQDQHKESNGGDVTATWATMDHHQKANTILSPENRL